MESEAKVSGIVEHLFRQEAGKIVSALTGSFGLQNLELVEDSVQEALLKALRLWSYGNIPPNPAAWLMQVARNQALDHFRRDTRWREKEEEISHEQEQSRSPAPLFSEEEIRDDQLRMIFACCHPALAGEAKVALTLKILCGFSVSEIARAFLVSPDNIAKRLIRARQRLQHDAVPFEIPGGAALAPRLDSVLDVLYLLFNEGYNASQGEELIRRDLCDEAIRLTNLLAIHPAGDTSKTHALFALFLFQRARFDARLSAVGEILLLHDQNRAAWDRNMIRRGMSHLALAGIGETISEFHLQAGIASCHCIADRYEQTNWKSILFFYDLLLELNHSPVVALNRAVAVSKVHSAKEGLAAIAQIPQRESLENYHLFYAVLGELHLASQEQARAKEDFERAIRLTSIPAEQNFLRRRLRELSI